MRGKFISFEGLDGAGKSTQIDAVVTQLRSRGHVVVATREPGGTPLGEKLRALVLSEDMHLETETLIMFAGRREHLARTIEPALVRGDWVVCDRFTDATYAYQGGGRGLDAARIAQLEAWVHPDLQPDLTLLFDLPFTVARERLDKTRSLDRFEQEESDFHERVRSAYRARAAAFPDRIRIVDAVQTPDKINKLVEELVASIC